MNAFDEIEILLVEDNPYDAEMTMRALTKSSLITRVYWVRDGVEALDFVHRRGAFALRDATESLKLVLLDLKMPRLGGLDVLRDMKSDVRTREIPVVVMTSSNQERDLTESYQFGVNGFVTKPVQFAQFMETVSKIGVYWMTVNQSRSK